MKFSQEQLDDSILDRNIVMNKIKEEIQMNTTPVQYYLDKNKLIDIRVDLWSHNRMHVSIYNDRNDSCVGYTCSREELKGLADFIYETIGEK
jgi:hypothetical protein